MFIVYFESIKAGLNNITKQKLRTLLNIIGFAFGIMVTISIISIGSMALNIVENYYSGLELGSHFKVRLISAKTAFELKIPETLCVELNNTAPDYIYGVSIHSNENKELFLSNVDTETVITAKGVSPASYYLFQISLCNGRFISNSDCEGYRATAIIPDNIAEMLYGSCSSAINQEIYFNNIDGVSFRAFVAGVYKSNIDDYQIIYFPYSFINKIFCEHVETEYSEIIVPYKHNAMNQGETAVFLNNFFMQNFPNEEVVVNLESPGKASEEIKHTIKSVSIMYLLIASIVFLVSGIGIFNTLMLSVNERTAEIGIRKAVGAKNYAIGLQFVSESIFICVTSCALGIGSGLVIIKLLNENFLFLIKFFLDDKFNTLLVNTEFTATIPRLIIPFLFFISCIIGIICGSLPSIKAMNMQVVDALRQSN